MAHKSKRKHVKHVHQHEHEHHEEHHERPRAASFRELGRALVGRVVSRALEGPRALKERLLRRPRAMMARISGMYSSLGPVAK